MPKGPQGQKRPANVIGNAVRIMQIATGEVEEATRSCPRVCSQRRVKGREGAGDQTHKRGKDHDCAESRTSKMAKRRRAPGKFVIYGVKLT